MECFGWRARTSTGELMKLLLHHNQSLAWVLWIGVCSFWEVVMVSLSWFYVTTLFPVGGKGF